MKEVIKKLSEKIVEKIRLEKDVQSHDESIGYLEGEIDGVDIAKWILREERKMTSQPVFDIHGCIIDYKPTTGATIYPPSQTIFRDSAAGKIIFQGLGSHLIKTPQGEKTAKTELLATYTNSRSHGGDAINGSILVQRPKTVFRFSSLVSELAELEKLSRELDSTSSKLEKLDRESAEAKSLVEELKKKKAEITALGERVKKHITSEVELRDQPLLDKYQDEVRRSKILNGTLIINGGPGTGKTTSLIQRIKFLTSTTILDEVGALTKEQAEILFNQNKSWIFYSPSELLRNYLANAMLAESLIADDEKVQTWEHHRNSLLRQTGLINPEKQRPFTSKRWQGENGYFKQSPKVYKLIDELFLAEFLDDQKRKVKNIHDEEITGVFDQKLSFIPADHIRTELKIVLRGIQDASKRALSFNRLDNWLPFYIAIQKEFAETLKAINEKLIEDINLEAATLQIRIKQNAEVFDWLENLIIEESKSSAPNATEDLDEEELDDEEASVVDVDQQLNLKGAIDRKLKNLLRILALRTIEPGNNRLTPKNKLLFEKLESFLNPDKLQIIGIRQYFKKYFERPLRGLENNILNPIPTSYKRFRRVLLNGDKQCLTDFGLLNCEAAIKSENKPLFHDEADYLLTLIFRMCKLLYTNQNQYFSNSSHPYIVTYKENIKAVVAIDEATDFSIWELIAMSQMAHPLFNCVTLSGDLMQRMTKKGIKVWEEYSEIIKNTEIRNLKKAYRQTAKLLEIASEIYSWNVSAPAEFISHAPADPLDPEPLVFIGDDEQLKIEWLVARIIEIQSLYGRIFPTIALFVKDDAEVLRIQNILSRNEALENAGLNVIACLQGQILGDKQSIRIFSIEYIKGLEFGAVFFLDLDKLSNQDDDLINKYIYVGLSRANLFLGITLNQDFNESIEYLRPLFKTGGWQLRNN